MTTTPIAPPGDLRRTDLDWIRIAAFGLLILYHVGVFYAPAPTAVGAWSPRVVHELVAPMLALSPWRLLLLFVVSGAATRFMAEKMSAGALFRSRASRLLIPLAFGMAVIVPPQVYVQGLERHGVTGGYLAFLGHYFSADQSFCGVYGCLIMPTWNHLWFVAYLFAYTALLTAALAWAPRVVAAVERAVGAALRGPGLLIVPALWLVAAKVLLGRAGGMGTLVLDAYGHATFLPAFLLGFAIVRMPGLWDRIAGLRWTALGCALGAYATIMTLGVVYLGADLHWLGKGLDVPTGGQAAFAAAWGCEQWFAILAALGFGHRHLRGRDGPVRRYLTEAVFPFYIIHQTTTEVAGHYLAPLQLPIVLEAGLIIGLTAASCVATYEIARRMPVLRPVFGLKVEARRPKPQPRPAMVWADCC